MNLDWSGKWLSASACSCCNKITSQNRSVSDWFERRKRIFQFPRGVLTRTMHLDAVAAAFFNRIFNIEYAPKNAYKLNEHHIRTGFMVQTKHIKFHMDFSTKHTKFAWWTVAHENYFHYGAHKKILAHSLCDSHSATNTHLHNKIHGLLTKEHMVK